MHVSIIHYINRYFIPSSRMHIASLPSHTFVRVKREGREQKSVIKLFTSFKENLFLKKLFRFFVFTHTHVFEFRYERLCAMTAAAVKNHLFTLLSYGNCRKMNRCGFSGLEKIFSCQNLSKK